MFISIVSESVTLQWKTKLKFLVENKISSTVSNHGVVACLPVFHAHNILHRDCSISFYVCSGGKELNGPAHPPSFPKNLQKKCTCVSVSVSRVIYMAWEWQEFPLCCRAEMFQKNHRGAVSHAHLLGVPQTPCALRQGRRCHWHSGMSTAE